MSVPVPVNDNQATRCFEVSIGGHLATLAYRREPGLLVLLHTHVPDELVERAAEASGRWLDLRGPALPAPERFLSLHHDMGDHAAGGHARDLVATRRAAVDRVP